MGISTHILDNALGRPAAQVTVTLTRWVESQWVELNVAETDDDGRIKCLLLEGHQLFPGLFRIRFDTAAYYQAKAMNGLYPYVDVVFETKHDEPHYHIPLLLTPNSYSTYRGS